MKERQIPYSQDMVRARREGRKTQTRRVVKPQPADLWPEGVECYSDARGPFRLGPSDVRARLDDRGLAYDAGCQFAGPIACPYGQPGDRLWVREAWRTLNLYDAMPPRDVPTNSPIWFEADGPAPCGFGRYRHARFMPRWVSRSMDEVVGVRVERLQDISEADAMAEGCTTAESATAVIANCNPMFPPDVVGVDRRVYGNTIAAYRALWQSINGPGSWDLNPFVWVIEFKRVQP